jgi:hypothetical protein
VRIATIAKLEDRTAEDERTGAMRSIQTAEICLPEAVLQELWTPMHLERLARTYWRFLTRVTLGLVRVRYSESERSVVLIGRAVKLLTFVAPEYEMDAGHGIVRWRIARGLLVARRGRDGSGYLKIEVRRYQEQARPGNDHDLTGDPAGEPAPGSRLQIEVEVAGFYPAIASRLGRRIYGATQSKIHVLITRGFLRSLARLDLAESRVGFLAGAGGAPGAVP